MCTKFQEDFTFCQPPMRPQAAGSLLTSVLSVTTRKMLRETSVLYGRDVLLHENVCMSYGLWNNLSLLDNTIC